MAFWKQLNSIRWRILAPMVLLILASNFVVLSSTIDQLDEQLVLSLKGDLNSETDIVSVQLQASIRELMRDTAWLRGLPPIDGMMRAEANGGIDPLDNSTLQAWKNRLAIIYSEMLSAKPTRVQIRYLLADGHELVRIDRFGPNNSVRVVPVDELQDKSKRDYFLEAKHLPPGHVYLSAINLNRENGVIKQPQQGVIRAATPVYNDEGKLHGVIVINESVDEIFNDLLKLVRPSHELRITNAGGEYLLHPEPHKAFQFDYGERSNIVDDFPELQPLFFSEGGTPVNALETEFELISEKQIVVAKSINHNLLSDSGHLTVVLSADTLAALSVRQNVFQRNAYIITLTLIVALVAGLFVTRYITAPILQMRRSISRRKANLFDLPLPVNAPGETGELAQAFSELLTKLDQRQANLESEIAERKLAQEQVESNVKKLSEANAELQQFNYIASHDLQEPLRTVKSFVELLQKNYADALDGNGQTALRFIIQSTTRMQELIFGLLNYSRIGVDAPRVEVDVQSLLGSISQDLAARIAEKRGSLEFHDMPVIRAQATEVRMLFQNLISNALKFSRDGVPPVVKIFATRIDKGWQFCVSDNGIGISEEHRERIFLIFQRLHRRDEIEGTGIGLAHCKKVVEMHGGKIWVETSTDGGSCFCLTIMDE
ncbi:HAMP domain-containing protein [Spongiibacter sp. KMU-158]|uniref:histidine kinase n=1 Tax=Spongiibacter pelagi TaxID=2760804 RepID=A0A927BZB7_9GAMM|nr:ATP-binding protein [Spongiibacter pelagi]MBD2858359.1 HAMP domain-containing protein [Spongiibacter pelagi]